MKKRVLPILLTVCMLVSTVLCVLPANAETEKTYLAQLDMDGNDSYTLLNANSASIAYTGTVETVTNGTNHYLKASYAYNKNADTARPLVKVPFVNGSLDLTKDLVVEGKYMIDSTESDFYITLKESGSNGLSNKFDNLLIVKNGGKIYFAGNNNGTEAGYQTNIESGVTLSANTWYTLKVVIHLDTYTKDLYVDGIKKVSDVLFLTSADVGKSYTIAEVQAINGAKTIDGHAGNIFVDDFAVYYETQESTVDPREYLISTDFESLTVGTNNLATGSIFFELPSNYAVVKENNDTFVRVYGNSTTGNGLGLAIGTAKDKTSTIIVEETVRWHKGTGESAWAWCQQFACDLGSFMNTNRVKSGRDGSDNGVFDITKASGAPTLQYDTWYTFKFVINQTTGDVEWYVDGALYGTRNVGKTNFTMNRRFCLYKSATSANSAESYFDVADAKAYYQPATTSFIGGQTSASLTQDGTYSVRLISTLETLNVEAAGFEVDAVYEGGSRHYEKICEYAYTSIKGGNETYNATDFSYNYLIALHLNGIDASIGEITFTVKPFVYENGEKVYGKSGTVTLSAPQN